MGIKKQFLFSIVILICLASFSSALASTSSGGNVEYIPASRNLGIGVVAPGAKLDVNGQLMIRGGTPGSGKLLQSDASGLATWVATSSITGISATNITSGLLGSAYGGTGVNNSGTLTYGSNNVTFSTSGTTSLTLPTSGTVATLAGTETFTNKTLTSPTINSATINNPTITGTLTLGANAQFQDPVINGTALFTNNSIAKFNGGILIPGGAGSNKVLTSDGSGVATWQDASGLSGGNAATVDSIDSSQFLRSDTDDSFTNGTLFFDTATTLDINGNLSIADTNISFDGANTTFTQTSGSFTVVPASGSNIINTIASGGEFKINTSDLVFNGRTARVGIGTADPSVKLDVAGTIKASGQINGTIANFTTINATTFIGDGSQLTGVAAANGSINNVTVNNGTVNDTTITNSIISSSNLQDPTMNGKALFNNNSVAKFNGTILIQSGAGANKVLTSDASGYATWVASSSLSTSNASLLDNIDSNQFLRSDTSDSFSSGTLSLDTGTTLAVNGNLAMKPSAVINITAGGGISPTKAVLKIQGNSGAVNISVAPQISNGSDGQILILKGASNTNTVTLDHGDRVVLIDGLSFTLGNKDMITLIYDATDEEWIEISRSDAI